ncbi:VanZ family protein [Lysinibacillus sphaericus]|uniref:VanZ family protein n=1 Tax=Lysinibacillus sphaericus TaxID=1421 RepID=UPI0025A1D091|nr:VanZ family protein [Lysinibacillus sphaericus]MDM5349587.1 VanZ family protein [Lysinibacillus sphaericus]MEB7453315.1 VanZ family protein [Lysinibacillus sphaericus]
MGIAEIMSNIKILMLPVILIIGFEFLLIALYYFYYQRRRTDRHKQIPVKKLLLGAMFIGYIVFVLELTVIGRGTSHYMQMNLQPFSGYIDAWKKYSLRDLQNCLFNILMFVPLGMFLPLLMAKCKEFKWLLLVVVGATASIETYQTLSGAGIFELDDLINNSLGGIIGYQLYKLAVSISNHKKVKVKSLIGNLAIPLLMGLIFIVMSIVYAQQEFGHLAINAYTKSKMSDVHVSTSLELSAASIVAPVFKKNVKNDDVKDLLQQKLGLLEVNTSNNQDNDETLLEDKNEVPYTLITNDSEGQWWLTENNYTPEQTSAVGQEDKAKSLMDELSLLPQDAEFAVQENGEFEWTLPDRTDVHKDYWTGDISLGLKPDGHVYSLTYSLHENQFIREVNILSPTEVYERIKEGDFPQIKYNALVQEEDLIIKNGDHIEIDSIELSYMYDTKGFYQPIYNVAGKFNGNDWFTLIQARK